MTYLLDANVLIWFIYQENLLTDRVLALMRDPANRLLLSHAMLWETASKFGRGSLLMKGETVDHFVARVHGLGVELVPFVEEDILRAVHLPRHHADPFDRIIIAQAQRLAVPLLTSDRMFSRYAVTALWK